MRMRRRMFLFAINVDFQFLMITLEENLHFPRPMCKYDRVATQIGHFSVGKHDVNRQWLSLSETRRG